MTVHFGRAAFELVDLVALVPPERLGDPGLGEWTLRELIGHTSRALSTVVAYLAQPAPLDVTVHSASEYLEVVLRQRGDDAAIAARGRESAELLGDDVVGAVADLAVASVEAVERAGLDRLVAIGEPGAGLSMRLDEYLRTRSFELTVHGIDIADAAGVAWAPPQRAPHRRPAPGGGERIRPRHGRGGAALPHRPPPGRGARGHHARGRLSSSDPHPGGRAHPADRLEAYLTATEGRS